MSILGAFALSALVAVTVVLAAPVASADPGGSNGVTVTNNFWGIETTVTSRQGSAGQPSTDRAAPQLVNYAPGPNGQTCVMTPDVGDRSLLSTSVSGLMWTLSCPSGQYTGVFVGGGGRLGFVQSALTAVPVGGQAPVSPTVLAQRAESLLLLPAPAARHNPSEALTGLATWWWVDPAQWRTLSQRTAAGPVWAQVTARPVSSTWDAGDGTAPLTCAGPGTSYSPNEPASAQSSDCTHTYTRSSAGQPQTGPEPNDRYFTVSVTVRWAVSWVGAGGTAGSLPPIGRRYSFPLRVAERETVMTSGSG